MKAYYNICNYGHKLIKEESSRNCNMLLQAGKFHIMAIAL